MFSATSLPHLRLTPQVPAQRQTMPYSNYASPYVLERSRWAGPRGYGARHPLDDAPFSLWDEEKKDFRMPSSLESNWMVSRYSATAIDFQFPMLIIETEHPPIPLPLTVAAVAAKFVPQPPSLERFANGIRVQPIEDARPIEFSTNYAGMKGPADPLPFTLEKWVQPTEKQLNELVTTLCRFCNPHLVHIMCPRIVVELRYDDDRVYEPGSLPRRVGGYAVHYHHQPESVFKGLSIQGKQRFVLPSTSIHDTSNYLSQRQELCPGVRISSGRLTRTGIAQVSSSTTAGILLRNSHGQQRLTVANHGFVESDEVFHPTDNGTQIGEIDERWEHLDIALVKLNPSVRFNNSCYFEARKPRRLLRWNEIPDGAFFAVDGMSTGIVHFQSQGTTLDIPARPSGMTDIHFSKMRLCRCFGSTSALLQDGVCGAAFVENDTDDGGVACFFQNANENWALNPCLDELIDCSWSVV